MFINDTCLWAGEDPMVFGSNLLDGFFAVDCSVGQYHGRIVLVHDFPCNRAHKLAVHVLGPRQPLRKLLKLLQWDTRTM
jgi:hypothetical protein